MGIARRGRGPEPDVDVDGGKATIMEGRKERIGRMDRWTDGKSHFGGWKDGRIELCELVGYGMNGWTDRKSHF